MAVTTIPWGDGSGDNIYVSASAQTGIQTVDVSSDANLGIARSKTITFTSGVGSITRQLTVEQEAGAAPTSYITNGLVLWMDGIDHGNGTAWVDKISAESYTNENNRVTFGTNYALFTGSNKLGFYSYYMPPLTSVGTIEVLVEPVDYTANGIVFQPQSDDQRLAFGFYQGKVLWSNTSATAYDAFSGMGTYSMSAVRAMHNGTAMAANGATAYASRSATTSYIGKRSGTANQQTPFNGKIYCIRIYNRQLSEAEVRANYAYDRVRFNF